MAAEGKVTVAYVRVCKEEEERAGKKERRKCKVMCVLVYACMYKCVFVCL